MYVLELDCVTDTKVLDILYKWLDTSGIISKSYLVRNITQFTEDLNAYPCHFVKLELENMIDRDEDELVDILMDISFNKKQLIVDTKNASYEFIQKFKDECRLLHIDYRLIGKDQLDTISITEPSKNDIRVIKELLNHSSVLENNENTFGFRDFMIRFKINNKGEVYNDLGKKVGSITKSNLFNIFLKLDKEHLNYIKETVGELEEAFNKYGVNAELIEPWYFLGDCKNMVEDIIAYKYRVFDLIKNISLYSYKVLPDGVIKILQESRYIPLDSIIRIENKNDDLFITDWFIKAVLDKSKRKGDR